MITKIGPCFKRQYKKNTVQIRSILGDKNLDIKGNKIENQTEIILYQAHGGESQTFIPNYNFDLTVTFVKGKYAIDVRWGEAKNGTVIQIWEKNNTLSQKFILLEHSSGYVSIHSAINPMFVIDVEGACTDDYTKCPKFWKINSTNNIQCIDTCDNYIIHQGNNVNQCVENCQSYVNPLSSTSNPLLFYTCDNQKYCITYEYCKLKKLENDLTRCYSGKSCFDMNDFTPATDAPKTDLSDIKTEAIEPISEKVTIVKYFEFFFVYFHI